MKDLSHKRHIAKAFTWRLLGTIDTIIISWAISGNPFVGLKIGFAESISKMLLYYYHERLWFRSTITNANKRHIFKTITWRIVGTLDTILFAWLISGDPIVGIKIGGVEVITKMVLYYIHEKFWYKLNFGLENRRNKK